MRTIVLSAPGRSEITNATLEALDRQNPGETFNVWLAPGNGGKRDFWQMLAALAQQPDDLLLLEDDVRTARNFIAYARRWPSVLFTTFFNGWPNRSGALPSDGTHFFHFTQAIKVPARLVAALTVNGATPPELGRNQDDAIGWELHRLRELVHYHRPTLVQHVGDYSLAMPGEKLDGLRVAVDFVGEDFDCATL